MCVIEFYKAIQTKGKGQRRLAKDFWYGKQSQKTYFSLRTTTCKPRLLDESPSLDDGSKM